MKSRLRKTDLKTGNIDEPLDQSEHMMLGTVTPLQVVFYFFAGLAISSAVVVITVRNPVHSVLALVVAFFAMAGTWMILRAEFLSLILLLVYVGAVMTLFLFVVMMLDVHIERKQSGFVRYVPFVAILVLLVIGLIIAFVAPASFNNMQMPVREASNVQQLGMVLYTDYAYPFEIAAVILLAAIIAAITLAHRGPRQRKGQEPAQQIGIRLKDRIRLVSMPAEKKGPISEEGGT